MLEACFKHKRRTPSEMLAFTSCVQPNGKQKGNMPPKMRALSVNSLSGLSDRAILMAGTGSAGGGAAADAFGGTLVGGEPGGGVPSGSATLGPDVPVDVAAAGVDATGATAALWPVFQSTGNNLSRSSAMTRLDCTSVWYSAWLPNNTLDKAQNFNCTNWAGAGAVDDEFASEPGPVAALCPVVGKSKLLCTLTLPGRA